MVNDLRKLMELGGIIERSELFDTYASVFKCRVGGRLVSSLILSHEDMTKPEFNLEERVDEWARDIISELEGGPNEQAESTNVRPIPWKAYYKKG